MKIARKLSARFIIVSVAFAIVTTSGVAVAVNLNHQQAEKASTVAVVQHNAVSTTDAAEKPEKPNESVTTENTADVTETPATEPAAPQVLTTQEYGEKYLDLSTNELQNCFNNIVNEWPERFASDLRETNVKALRAFASTCSTGALNTTVEKNIAMHRNNLYDTIIYRFGSDGAFFDSDLAQKAINLN